MYYDLPREVWEKYIFVRLPRTPNLQFNRNSVNAVNRLVEKLTTPKEYEEAAEHGHVLDILRSDLPSSQPPGRTNVYKRHCDHKALKGAAKGGNRKLMDYIFRLSSISTYWYNSYALEGACIGGHITIVKKLIQDIKQTKFKRVIEGAKNEMLEGACESGNIELAEYVINDIGADELGRGFVGACRGGCQEMINLLEQHGYDFSSCLGEALEQTCKNGHFGIVKFLMKERVDNLNDINQGIRGACKGGHLEIVKYLLNAINPEEPHLSIEREEYFLDYALIGGNMDIVEYILDLINEPLTQRELTATLHLATAYACPLISAKYLIKMGADPGDGLFGACEGGSFELVKYIVEKCGVANSRIKSSYEFASDGRCWGIARWMEHEKIYDYLRSICEQM